MNFAIGAARIAIGLLLLVAGLLKAHDGPVRTAATIAGYRILPKAFNAGLGAILPYLEILLSGYLIAGFYTRGAAIVAGLQFLVFAGAVASLVIRQLPVDCGCFGSALATPPSWGHVAADVALALVAFATAFLGPGSFSVDGPRVLGDRAASSARPESERTNS